MKDTILNRTEGNLTYHVYKKLDEDADLSYLKQEYADYPKRERATYLAQDLARLDAYRRGEWYMVGVVCDVSIETSTNWAVPRAIASASLWGIESDSKDSYFLVVAEDLIVEARHDLENVKVTLTQSGKCHARGKESV